MISLIKWKWTRWIFASIFSFNMTAMAQVKTVPQLNQHNTYQQPRQILPPNKEEINNGLQYLPPPNTRAFYGACSQAFVTKLSYQFLCWDYNRGTLMPDQRATFILRRDGSQPDWAMSGEDFSFVNDLFKNEKTTGFNYDGISGWTTEYDENGEPIYIRGMPVTIFLLYSIQEQQAPPKYCSVNPRQNTIVKPDRGTPGYGQFLCLDLMAVSYNNHHENGRITHFPRLQ